MKNGFRFLAIGLFGLGLTACGPSNSITKPISNNNAPGTYVQFELLSRPAVKELFEKFVDHQTTNAVEPYNDPTLQGEIKSFTDALRPPAGGADYGAALASILYPNEYAVDLSQAGNASYLGVETAGATGGKFGGRAVTDDVIDISLGAVFGNTLSALGVQPDDHQENACLSKQNIAQDPTQVPTATFPYLAAPH